MSVNRTSLGKRISFYRSKSTLTQEALAAKVNCSREYIVQIENGTKVPSLFVLVKIANTLSVSADELLLDCLEYSSSSANSEIHRLLLDCNETEQTVIIRMAKELKATLVSLGCCLWFMRAFDFLLLKFCIYLKSRNRCTYFSS